MATGSSGLVPALAVVIHVSSGLFTQGCVVFYATAVEALLT